MGLAGARIAERDDVLPTVDVLTASELQHQGLVEAGDGLEVEAVETFDGGKAGRLDAPLDHAAFTVDQLQLGEAQQKARVVHVLCGALSSKLLMLAQEGRQLELLEVMGEQDLWGLAHGREPPIRLI